MLSCVCINSDAREEWASNYVYRITITERNSNEYGVYVISRCVGFYIRIVSKQLYKTQLLLKFKKSLNK